MSYDDDQDYITDLTRENQSLKSRVEKQEDELERLRVDVQGLERFRKLRRRHNDEMQQRTGDLADADKDLQRLRALIATLDAAHECCDPESCRFCIAIEEHTDGR